MTAPRVLFLGDASHAEFREPLAWLREYCELTIANDVAAAVAQLAGSHDPPAVIVLAAARPGQFSQHDFATLLLGAPLARFIGLMGGWCEGEVRTGQPWRGVTRVYCHQFVARLADELSGVNPRGRLAMPRTFTEAEFGGLTFPLPKVTAPGLVVIRAASLETYEAIADACQTIGHSTVWASPRRPVFVSGAVAGIWDVAASIAFDEAELGRLTKDLQPAPVLAMIGFPRTCDRQVAFDCGASSVLSKPFLLQELWSELARMTSQCSTAAPKHYRSA